jgi:hypothetical protein
MRIEYNPCVPSSFTAFSPNNILGTMPETRAKTNVHLRANCKLLLSYLNQNWNMQPSNLILKTHSNCYKRIDRYSDANRRIFATFRCECAKTGGQ